MVIFTMESLSVVAGNFTPSFSLKFLSIFMYISVSNEPITLISGYHWIAGFSRKFKVHGAKFQVAGENFFPCRANHKKCIYIFAEWPVRQGRIDGNFHQSLELLENSGNDLFLLQNLNLDNVNFMQR